MMEASEGGKWEPQPLSIINWNNSTNINFDLMQASEGVKQFNQIMVVGYSFRYSFASLPSFLFIKAN